MNELYCEKEEQIASTIRSGSCAAELLDHARQCPVCSEIMRVAEFLQEEAKLADHELNALPDASLLWRKAQALAREQALSKATLPIRLVRTCAYVVAAFAGPWLVFESFQASTRTPNLRIDHLSTLERIWTSAMPTAMSDTLLVFWIVATVLTIGLSSWYMLREE